MEYQSYLNRLQKKGSNPHKIGHCLGVRDAWKWVRKNKWQAVNGNNYSHNIYSKVINRVNQILVEKILEGHEFELPYQMGSIHVCSVPAKILYDGDRLKNNYRVDWKKTLELWYEDKEAEANKVVIKRVQKNIYFIKYSKGKAAYINKRFYSFRANRSFSRLLGKAIETGAVRAMPLK